MSTNYQFVVYAGASGYTGKHNRLETGRSVASPFIAQRPHDSERLQMELAMVPSSSERLSMFADPHDRKSLADPVSPEEGVVINIVGPVHQLEGRGGAGRLWNLPRRRGCHYFDNPGEMDWVKCSSRILGPKFNARTLGSCPANSLHVDRRQHPLPPKVGAGYASPGKMINGWTIVYLGALAPVSEAATASFRCRHVHHPHHYLRTTSW